MYPPVHAVLLGVVALAGCVGTISTPVGEQLSFGDEPACVGVPDPGATTIRRLNRNEYNNTVRDLLHTAQRPADGFPADDFGSTFNNTADLLSIAPLLVEKYEAAAEQLAAAAVPALQATYCSAAPDFGPCAHALVVGFGARAWRRPLENEEATRLESLGADLLTLGDGQAAALAGIVQALLLSPHFLFRVEAEHEGAPYAVSDYELANRLSYFLWGSMPDDALFAAAASGRLHEPEVLAEQVTRLGADERGAALVDILAGQWLRADEVNNIQPDPARFPLDAPLRAAMTAETKALLAEVLAQGAPRDLLTPSYAFVNDRLAEHYGMAPVGSDDMVRVAAGESGRGGVLAMASFLATTSGSQDTSPVRRGKWIMQQLMCSPPPPPPPGVEGLDVTADPNASKREQMAQHRSDPSCSGCHSVLDPLGLALENFDPLGRWRDEDDHGNPIDASGQMPDGTAFVGPKELADMLARDPNFAHCVTEQLFTYALGRELTPDDQCSVSGIVEDAEARGGAMSDYVGALVASDAFNQRGTPEVQP